MKADPQTTDALREYVVACEYHKIETPIEYCIIARSLGDAKEIARRNFVGTHTDICILGRVEEKKPDNPNRYLCENKESKSWLNR